MFQDHVCSEVKTRLESDTGTGGLYNPSSPLLLAVYPWGLSGESPPRPYATIQHVGTTNDEVFDANATAMTVSFQVDIWADRDDGYTDHVAAQSRVSTMLRRWNGMADATAEGVTWKASAVFVTGIINDMGVESTSLRTTYNCEVSFSRVSS